MSPRRAVTALLRSLWAQTTGALLVAYLVILPVVVGAVGRQEQDADVSARTLAEARLGAQSQLLRAALARQSAAIRGYLVVGDRSLLGQYDLGRDQAERALSAIEAEAAASGLGGAAVPVRAATAAWQSWAAEQAAAAPRPGAVDVALVQAGDQRLAAAQQAAEQLDAAARRAYAADEAGESGLDVQVGVDDLLGPALGNGAMLLVGTILIAVSLRAVPRLAAVATAVAGGARAVVPYTGRRNEIGSLARSMARWQASEASRRAIVDLSPVGLFTLGPDLLVSDANPALRSMFGVPPELQSPVGFESFVHPKDAESAHGLLRGLAAGPEDHLKMETRLLAIGGRTFWGSVTLAVVRSQDGGASHYVGMVEDITERRERLERAARVQRDLLPDAPPVLDGYELAGVCRPGREMGGDFYDWYRAGPGTLTLTLGDVMGKDMPAALLTAVVRTGLRTGAAQRSAGEAVRSVAASTGRDLERAGAFVTLFHAWLDLDAGALGYVDAGHGLLAVVGPGGARRVHGARGLPLGVEAGERYQESAITLEPGETLVAFSDGVLDVHPELEERLEAVGELLAGASTAREMAERLVTGPGAAGDDVTALVLRRHLSARGPSAS